MKTLLITLLFSVLLCAGCSSSMSSASTPAGMTPTSWVGTWSGQVDWTGIGPRRQRDDNDCRSSDISWCLWEWREHLHVPVHGDRQRRPVRSKRSHRPSWFRGNLRRFLQQ